ncbi:MAG: acetyl-CoA carboxylase carboxyltransferase subunit beta [Janthinobacterium lividum]
MSWLTEYVRPRIRTLLGRREVPDNLWTQCTACEQVVSTKELEAALRVCPNCGHHMRGTAQERLAWTFDPAPGGLRGESVGAEGEGEAAPGYTRIELPRAPVDPLGFRDQKRYVDRLRDARAKTGLEDALVVAHGTVGGHRCVVAAMAFEFMAGSMGAAVGEGIVAAARLAVLQSAPLVVFTSSGGARMQEGAISLMQMPRTTIATRMVKEAGLPFLVVLTDPTTGGVTASFAMLGDVAIAEPGALIGFAGARVIEQTVRETLPDGFQRAEYLHAHGIVDMVVHRGEMRATLARLLGLLGGRQAAAVEAA